MAAVQIKKHAGSVEHSLAAIPTGRSTRERLEALNNPELTGSVACLGSRSTESDTELTINYAVGTASSDGQRFRVLRPPSPTADWALCSWRWIWNCIARWHSSRSRRRTRTTR